MEAEGRLLKRSAGELALALVAIVFAAVLAVLGAGLVLAGIWLALDRWLGAASASAITGLVCLAAAGGVLWKARDLSK